MKFDRVEIQQEIFRRLAEHEVFLSFTDDIGAEAFQDWWYNFGAELFGQWYEENKELFE